MTAMVKKDGTYWEPETEQVIQWQRLYPDVDVYQELNAMAGWLEANPTKRKTLMPKFCNAWLKRAQDSGKGLAEKRPEKKRTREMTDEEFFSRDWARGLIGRNQ